ncbi:hypothetical protein MMPV_009470 [Pyropia vietnamensis]
MATPAGTPADGGRGGAAPVYMAGVDISDLPPVPAGFVRTIRALNAATDLIITGDDLRRELATLFPPARLFYADMLVLPLLYDELVVWLKRWDAEVPVEGPVRSTTALAGYLCDDDARVAALNLVADDEHTYMRVPDAANSGAATPVDARALDARLFSPVRREAGSVAV